MDTPLVQDSINVETTVVGNVRILNSWSNLFYIGIVRNDKSNIELLVKSVHTSSVIYSVKISNYFLLPNRKNEKLPKPFSFFFSPQAQSKLTITVLRLNMLGFCDGCPGTRGKTTNNIET